MLPERNELGDERQFTYDTEGNIIERVDFAGRATSYEHDLLGRLTEERGWDGEVYRYTYDGTGNLIEADNSASELRFAYDGAGRLAMSEDRLTEASRLIYERDAAGRIVRESRPEAGIEARYVYDARGNVAELTDPDGQTTRWQYDAAGSEIERLGPYGTVERRRYDPAGRLAAVAREAPGSVGRVAGGAAEGRAYAYTPGGRIAAEFDAQGYATRYHYDASGRLQEVSHTHRQEGVRSAQFTTFQMAGLAEPGAQPVRSNAAASGLTRWAVRTSVATEYRQQAAAHATALGLSAPRAEQQSYTGRYHYDDRGNRSRWDSAWGTIDYEYDGANRLLREGQRRYAYDPEGNMVLEQLAGVSEVRYGYDARGRVVAVERDYYGESDINRATSLRFAPQSESSERIGSIAGAYRHGSQSEASPPPGEPGRAFSLRHGELEAEQLSDGEAPPEAPEPSGPGSPAARHRHRGTTPDFGPAGVANYAYDPLGRRVERSVAPQGARSQTSRNSYRGFGFSLAAVHQASGGPSVSDLRRPGTGHGGGSVAAGRYTLSSVHIAVRGRTISEHAAPEGAAAAEQARYYHHDVRGSVRYISRPPARGNRGGAVTFDAFGLPADGLERFATHEGEGLMLGGRADGYGPLSEGYGYTGKRLDPFLGGYDYGFRHYTPATGRFFTEDPIKDGSNWYAYVNNDPVNFVDPLGLSPLIAAGLVSPDPVTTGAAVAAIAYLAVDEATGGQSSRSIIDAATAIGDVASGLMQSRGRQVRDPEGSPIPVGNRTNTSPPIVGEPINLGEPSKPGDPNFPSQAGPGAAVVLGLVAADQLSAPFGTATSASQPPGSDSSIDGQPGLVLRRDREESRDREWWEVDDFEPDGQEDASTLEGKPK